MRIRIAFAIAAIALLSLTGEQPPAHAATFTVTRTDDPAPDGCLPADCSLREAIIDANASAESDVVDLPAGVYSLTIGGRFEDGSQTGDLDVSSEITLMGPGAATTIVDASDIDRVFHVRASGDLSVTGVTMRNGFEDFEAGAGLFNEGGSVLIESSVIAENTEGSIVGCGGGLASWPGGSLTLRDSEVLDNTSASFGGGICNGSGSTMLLERVTVQGNSAPDDNTGLGGAIFNSGLVTVLDSLIEDNSADYAAAIHTGGTASTTMTIERTTISMNSSLTSAAIVNDELSTLTIRESTVRGNPAYLGGITSTGSLLIDRTTISGNPFAGVLVSGSGTKVILNSTISGNLDGGLWVDNTSILLRNVTVAENVDVGIQTVNGGSITASNALIATNGPDCAAELSSLGYLLIGSTSGCIITGDTTGNITGLDPMLGPLADNGGPTFTHALLADSPAISAGNPAAPGSADAVCAPIDQRGVARTQRCDIGAFEIVDADADGCSDGEELGPDEQLGGQRDPDLAWDFYDVDGTVKIDVIDIGLVRSKFNQDYPPYDRSAGAAPWAPGPPDGIVDAVDIGLVRASFNHSCQAAP